MRPGHYAAGFVPSSLQCPTFVEKQEKTLKKDRRSLFHKVYFCSWCPIRSVIYISTLFSLIPQHGCAGSNSFKPSGMQEVRTGKETRVMLRGGTSERSWTSLWPTSLNKEQDVQTQYLISEEKQKPGICNHLRGIQDISVLQYCPSSG